MTDTKSTGAAPLANPRREAFARSRAGGASRTRAYVEAGYRPSRPAASRLAKDPEVTARVAVIRAQAERAADAELEAAILVMLESAGRADLATAAGLREAREARLEARRLHAQLIEARGEG
jgi:hypothetical protein